MAALSWSRQTSLHVRQCVLLFAHHVHLFVTPQTIAHQAPLSVGFARQEYWSWLPFPPPGDLPDPGIELDLILHADFLPSESPGKRSCSHLVSSYELLTSTQQEASPNPNYVGGLLKEL